MPPTGDRLILLITSYADKNPDVYLHAVAMNFLGLCSDSWRNKLDRALRRVGYHLSELDDTLDDAVIVSPFGRGDSFLLQLKHLQELGWYGCLYRNDTETDTPGNDANVLADWKLDTGEKHAKSCYDVWIDWIVQAVRDAANPNVEPTDATSQRAGSDATESTDDRAE